MSYTRENGAHSAPCARSRWSSRKCTWPRASRRRCGVGRGCRSNRTFGINGESFENPRYLDQLIETMGSEAVPYDQKVTCCGGTLAF